MTTPSPDRLIRRLDSEIVSTVVSFVGEDQARDNDVRDLELERMAARLHELVAARRRIVDSIGA